MMYKYTAHRRSVVFNAIIVAEKAILLFLVKKYDRMEKTFKNTIRNENTRKDIFILLSGSRSLHEVHQGILDVQIVSFERTQQIL